MLGLAVGAAGMDATPVHAREAVEAIRLPAPAYPAIVSMLARGLSSDGLAALDAALADRPADGWPVEALALRAALLEQAERGAEAATAWTAVGALEPALDEFAERAAVTSLLSAGELDRAYARLSRFTDGSAARRQPDLLLQAADAYRRVGQPLVAAGHYRAVLAATRGPSAQADAATLGLAFALEASGDDGAALEQFHRAQVEHADSLTYIAARAEERRLATALGRLPSAFTVSEYRSLTGRLADASRFTEALELMEEWLGSSSAAPEIEAIEAGIVDVLYRGRRNAAAMARATRFLEQFPESPHASDVRLIQFRLHVREGRTEAVRADGYAFWRGRVPGASTAQRRSAALLMGAYLVSVGEAKSGLAVYREIYRSSTTSSQQRDILWRAGVTALRDGQIDRAAVNLRALKRLRPDGDLEQLTSYWLGVAEFELGNRAAAAEALLELVERTPYSYYGLQAAATYLRLVNPSGQADVERRLRPTSTFPDLVLTPGVVASPLYRAATVLARAGLDAPAAAFARRLAAEFRRDPAVGLLAARATATAGEHHLVLGLVDRHFRDAIERPMRNLPEDLLSLAYPRAYWNDLVAAGARSGVDPVLLASIMRQESRYEAPVRSVAGAVGLFQLMPYTAEALAREDGIPIPDEEDLKRPAVSAALGARLLARLLQQFSGSLAPVAASYNAGEDLVATWWRAVGDVSEPMFVDSIPYAETRTYVRRVLANYQAYLRIYGTD